METIGQHSLVICWLDMENFKTLVTNTNNVKRQSDMIRTQSLDLQNKRNIDEEIDKASENFGFQTKEIFYANINKVSSTSSCGNLVENKHETSKVCNVTNLTEEAVNLFKKYVAIEAPHQLDLSDNIRKLIISNICTPDKHIKEDCFKPVQDKIFNQIAESYFSDFVNSSFYVKAQIDILTSSSLNLKDILYNETILFYFTEYLEQESCRVLLEFLMASMHFRDNISNDSTSNTDQVQADAIVLYDKYFSLQALNPIGFPTDIRLKTESEICREGGPLKTCFDLPYQIVFKTLAQYVKSFLESDLYYRYLSEMINSIDSNHKSFSDCSSEYSISTQNTLLAMGDHVFHRKKRNHSVPDMSIDSNQLYNADSLWQRKRHDGLSLGRINSLGRFESKLEPDPDKKESVLKKVVSRFVPMSASKVEEEMAWQIAHMIVKDVTDLTMAPPDNEHDEI